MKGMKSFRSWLSRNGLKTVIVLVFSLSALFALYPFAADFLQQQFQSTVIST